MDIIKHGKINIPTGREYVAKIGLLTDIHIGIEGYYSWGDYSQLDSIIEQVNAQGFDFVVTLGDSIDSGYNRTPEAKASQLEILNEKLSAITVPVFRMRGNHDVHVDQFTTFGTITFGDYSIVCIFPKYVDMNPPTGQTELWSNGQLTSDDISWINDALDATAGTERIMLSHYCLKDYEDGHFKFPICGVVDSTTNPSTKSGETVNGHRDELIDLLTENDVKLFVSGHEHIHGLTHGYVDDTDIMNVQASAVVLKSWYNSITIYADRFEVKEHNVNGTVDNTVTVNFN